MNTNIAAMVMRGYVVSPNNIHGVEGVLMYASGPGVLEVADKTLIDIQVTDLRIRVLKARYCGGQFIELETVAQFSDAELFFEWLQFFGKPSEGGSCCLDQGVCD